MENEKKHILKHSDIVTDLKGAFLGKQPGCAAGALAFIFTLSLIAALATSLGGGFLLFALPFFVIAALSGWALGDYILQTIRYISLIRHASYVIDPEPSPLLYTETYETRGGKRGEPWITHYRFVFASGKWEAPEYPYPSLKDACLPAMNRERNSAQHKDPFYLIKDKKGKILYAYNTNFFTLSEELAHGDTVHP